MKDNEIIKALECCKNRDACSNCPYNGKCTDEDFNDNYLLKDVIDLIKRQQAEIERYKGVIKRLESDVASAKYEMILEFGLLVIERSKNGIIFASDIPDIAAEMRRMYENFKM